MKRPAMRTPRRFGLLGAVTALAGCISIPDRTLPAFEGAGGEPVFVDATGPLDASGNFDAAGDDARVAPRPDARPPRPDALPDDARVPPPRPDAGCLLSSPETCNGLDDDCDGVVDDGLESLGPCYGGPPDTMGVGVCRAGERRCEGGAPGRCEGEVLPAAEACNGADDDCDGDVDDDGAGEPLLEACYDGPAATAGVGTCVAGWRACVGGRLSECQGQVVPGPETCDERDEDCNGAIDDAAEGCACERGEERACYPGPPGTAGVGQCREGRQECGVRRVWGPCERAVSPAEEVCNGRDDDCDGETDEGLPGCVPCEPDPEACNGRDDDCDGAVDEGTDGDACSTGIGACRGAGSTLCVAGELRCDAVAGAPGEEVCNGIDDDCDGNADEDLFGPPCFAGEGACRREGREICVNGAFRCSEEARSPAPETCNGQDDDCDGGTDEDFTGIGESCSVGRGDCQREGRVVCTADGAGASCDAVPGPPVEEACDGRDNDCDGEIDEGLAIGEPCIEGVGQCEREGRARCVGGVVACDAAPGSPDPEICDGQDNDCNGVIDDTGEPCFLP
ncbi:hypothetical protein L6V77_33805 [Myxococcota bacterium]|nr:hypothetical protein [Myxococcota bacterium]